MCEFDTDDVWDAMTKFGRFKTPIDFRDLNEYREQLHSEARDEGVQLRINVEGMPSARPTLCIYLRKMT